MIGVELMALGMYLDSFVSLFEPVLGLLVSLSIDVELVQEGLDVSLVLYG